MNKPTKKQMLASLDIFIENWPLSSFEYPRLQAVFMNIRSFIENTDKKRRNNMPKTHTKKGWLLINKRGPVPLPGTFRPIFSYDKKEVTIWRNRPEHIVPAVLTWEKLEEEK